MPNAPPLKISAARTMGGSESRTLFTEVLPNSMGPVIEIAALDLGNAILIFSGLSFLGLGALPLNLEWGPWLRMVWIRGSENRFDIALIVRLLLYHSAWM
jgi:ABC-type microcin C transport system permease subunit YejE